MDDNIKSSPLFSVIFKDNSKYLGGNSYFKTKWIGIPNKPIKRIFYLLPTKDYLCLTGEAFFHMVEVTTDLNGKNQGKTILRYVYIMVKKGNEIISYRITLYKEKTSRYHSRDITVRSFDINNEFIRGLNPDGWRPKLK